MDGKWLLSSLRVELWLMMMTYVAARHVRFLTPSIARKYDLDMPKYEGLDQIVELVDPEGQKL